MKKLVYILSLTIGLIMTGCTQWENVEPLSPEAIGSSNPELTVTAPDSITSDVITFTIATKNASHLAFMVVQGTGEVDYTALLQGRYSNANAAEVDPEGFEQTFNMRGAVPGEVYSIFVVAADSVGVQKTFEKVMGAFDVESPYVAGDPNLTATNNGTRATVTFNEAILRADNMGAITYDVYDADFNVILEGTATAVANGSELVVSLPSTVVFDAVVYVLLSFEEGAVEDLYGNKMAAIDNYLEDGLPNGPWWSYDPEEVIETDSFFRDGHGYAFVGKINLGNGMQEFGGPIMPLTYVESNVEIGEVSATAWTMPSILNMFGEEAISSGAVTPNEEVPAYTYASTVNSQETEIISFYDKTNGFPVLGTMILGQNNQTYTVYAADYDEEAGQVYPGWDFAVFEFQGGGQTFDGCAFIGKSPVIITIDGNQAGMVAEIDPEAFQFHDGDILMGSSKVDVLDTPVVLKNVNVNREKVFRIAE